MGVLLIIYIFFLFCLTHMHSQSLELSLCVTAFCSHVSALSESLTGLKQDRVGMPLPSSHWMSLYNDICILYYNSQHLNFILKVKFRQIWPGSASRSDFTLAVLTHMLVSVCLDSAVDLHVFRLVRSHSWLAFISRTKRPACFLFVWKTLVYSAGATLSNRWCRSCETMHVSIDVSVRALTNDRLEAWQWVISLGSAFVLGVMLWECLHKLKRSAWNLDYHRQSWELRAGYIFLHRFSKWFSHKGWAT